MLAFNLTFTLLDRTTIVALLIVDHLVCAQLCKILSTQFLTTSNSFIHLGSIPKWIPHSILNFAQVEPPLNAMALVLSSKCLGNEEFGDVFSILTLLLSQFLVVPFLSIHLHFNHLSFQILPQISSQIPQSIHISIPIYPLSQMRQFPLSILLLLP